MDESLSLALYYLDRGFTGHAAGICQQAHAANGQDSTIGFWGCVALVLEGQFNRGIRGLEPFRQRRDIEFPVLCALKHAHESCRIVDHAEVSKIELLLEDSVEGASVEAILMTCRLYCNLKEWKQARRLLTKAINRTSTSDTTIYPKILSLSLRVGLEELRMVKEKMRDSKRDQAELQNQMEEQSTKLQAIFEDARKFVKQEGECVELLLSLSCYQQSRQRYQEAVELVNQIIVKYPYFSPALAEKAKLLAVLGDWDNAVESVQRLQEKDRLNAKALQLLIFCGLSRGDISRSTIVDLLQLLASALEQRESGNANLWAHLLKPLVALSDRDAEVLEQTLKITQQGLQIDSRNGDLLLLRGQQLLLLGQLEEASEIFQTSAKLEGRQSESLLGLIHCQLLMGQYQDSQQQIELLKLVDDAASTSPLLRYLEALLSFFSEGDMEQYFNHLNMAVKLHMERFKKSLMENLIFSPLDEAIALAPDFLLRLAEEFLFTCWGWEGANEKELKICKKGGAILTKVTRKYPGMYQAMLSLGQAFFIARDFRGAAKTMVKCLRKFPNKVELHLLQARTAAAEKDFKQVEVSLDRAVSEDFAVRASPIYITLRAQILRHERKDHEALKALLEGLALMKKKKKEIEAKSAPQTETLHNKEIDKREKAEFILELINLRIELGQLKEAMAMIRTAAEPYKGTPAEFAMIMAQADISLKKNNVEGALAVLNQVGKESSLFAKAQSMKADIYLSRRNDKKRYLQCFQDALDVDSTPSSYIEAGLACTKIQELDKAIDLLQRGLEKHPGNPEIVDHLSNALLRTHDYSTAITYYERALSNDPGQDMLRFNLVSLLLKLKKYSDVLSWTKTVKGVEDPERMIELLRMKGEALLALDKYDEAATILKTAWEEAKIQYNETQEDEGTSQRKRKGEVSQTVADAASSGSNDGPGTVDELILKKEELQLAKVGFLLGKVFEKSDEETAISWYDKALECCPSDEMCLQGLLQLQIKRGDEEEIEILCSELLKYHPGNEQAAVALTNLLFRKEEIETAVEHFEEILASKPDNFTILQHFILLLFRAGRNDEVSKALARAEEKGGSLVCDQPGFHFCKGLQFSMDNDPASAIHCLNQARRSGQWIAPATAAMVKLYLDPGQSGEWRIDPQQGAGERHRQIAQRIVEDLPKSASAMKETLQCEVLLHSPHSQDIDEAIQMYAQLLEKDRDHVPALLGLATAFQRQKQSTKARNQLKRIAKLPFVSLFADEFEQAYLMLAEMYKESGKFDLAQDLCTKCLNYNKSCARAWEMNGGIMEREHSYKDAAEHYEKSWRLQKESSAVVGYKLAYNYVKAGEYVKAIQICGKVLAKFPEYPKIKEEVLEIAQQGIRP